MKLKKKMALLLCVSMLASAAVGAAAHAETDKAAVLYQLGLLQGVSGDTSFDPGRDLSLTREEAVTAVVRFMGKEQYALALNAPCAFGDVSDWAAPYVAYAAQKGIAAGKSDTDFGAADRVTMRELCAFYLRGMGYGADGTDLYETALAKAAQLGMIRSETDSELTRNDFINVSYQVLYAKPYSSPSAVIRELVSAGAVSLDALKGCGDEDVLAAYNSGISAGSFADSEVPGDLANAASLNLCTEEGQKLTSVTPDMETLIYNGKNCVKLGVGAKAAVSVDSGYMTAEDSYCTVLVTYFDSGVDKIRVSYSDRMLKYRDLYISKTNTGKWKTAALTINDAAFSHKQENGADITVWAEKESGAGTDEYISEITLIKQKAEDQTANIEKLERVINTAYIRFKKITDAVCFSQSTSTNESWYGYTTPAEIDGEECVSIGVDKRCVLRLDDEFMLPDENHCTIHISYYDNGTVPFIFCYPTEANRYTEVKIERNGTDQWKTLELKLDDVSFMNRQDEGIDLTFWGEQTKYYPDANGTVYISSVEVIKN